MINIINKLEKIRHLTKNGAEHWFAREIQELLDYTEWRNFEQAIRRAKETCKGTGKIVDNHFVSINKMVLIGSGGERRLNDYALSRYACYLIAMNGDTSKPEIAKAQEYFAIETRKSELFMQIENHKARIDEREYTKENHKKLNCAAQAVGVTNFGRFINSGYEAMYGGLNNQEIKKHKNIPDGENLLDRIGRAELAANNFRMTQAETRLHVEDIEGEDNAVRVHAETGKIVRETMEKAGKTMPENMPIEPHIREVKKIVRKFDNLKISNFSST